MKGQVLTTICVGLLSATMAYADSSENMGGSDNMNGTGVTNGPAGSMNDMPSMPSHEPPSNNPDANPEGGSADTATGDDNDY